MASCHKKNKTESTEDKEMLMAIDSTQLLLPTSLRKEFPGQSEKSIVKIHFVYALMKNCQKSSILVEPRPTILQLLIKI